MGLIYFSALYYIHVIFQNKSMLILLIIADSLGIRGFSKEPFWLAGNDLEKEGDWRWGISGKVVSFSNWIIGQPNNERGGQNCMAYIYPAMAWRDRCRLKKFPICELYWQTVILIYCFIGCIYIHTMWMMHFVLFPWNAFQPHESHGSGIRRMACAGCEISLCYTI